jgi:hypothetical protein
MQGKVLINPNQFWSAGQIRVWAWFPTLPVLKKSVKPVQLKSSNEGPINFLHI